MHTKVHTNQQQSGNEQVCTEVVRIINNIMNENKEDSVIRKILHLTLKARTLPSTASLRKSKNLLRANITRALIEEFIEQIIKKYTTEEQLTAFIREVCKTVLHPAPPLGVVERLSQILDKDHITKRKRVQSNTATYLCSQLLKMVILM